MTIKRIEKFNEWSAARQFYSNFIGWGYHAVYDKISDNEYIVTIYE